MLRSKLNQNPLVQKLKASAFKKSEKHLSNNRWYGAYRNLELNRILASPLDLLHLPPKFGLWLDERAVEYPWLFSQLQVGPGSLLDAGSTLNHHNVLHHPSLLQKKITIMTLAPEDQCFWREGISYIFGDLRSTLFQDECFDTIASISVIEHIGLDNSIYDSNLSGRENDPEGFRSAVAEFRRILRAGGTCLVTVPYGVRSVRKWLQVFDAHMIDAIVREFSPASYDETYFRYTDAAGWQLSTRDEASNGGYFDFRTDTSWAGCPAAAGAVACLRLTK